MSKDSPVRNASALLAWLIALSSVARAEEKTTTFHESRPVSKRISQMSRMESFFPLFFKLHPFKGGTKGSVFGPFFPRIHQSRLREDAQQSHELIEVLPSRVRAPLLSDWRIAERHRSDLLTPAAALDKEDGALFRDGESRENAQSLLHGRVDALNHQQIGDYNRQCADQEFTVACRDRQNQVMAATTELRSDIDNDNERVRTWNARYDALFEQAKHHVKKVNDWETLVRSFAHKAHGAIEHAEVTAVDFMAQGADMPKGKTVKVRQSGPLCDVTALHALLELEETLTPGELRQRDEALRDARNWVMNRPAEGWWSPSKTFYNRDRPAPDARVHVRIIAGLSRMFNHCPGRMK